MKANKQTKADKIIAAFKANPEASKSKVAKQIGVSVPYVYDVLAKNKTKKIVITKAEADLANKAGVSTKLLALQKLKTMKLTASRKAEIERQIKAELEAPVVGDGDEYEHKDGKWQAVNIDKVHEATNTDALLAERGKRYGTFAEHAKVTQLLKICVHGHAKKHGKDFTAAQAEALDMICHKIGRIVNGDPDYVDSWRDIEGYAKLVADELETGKQV